MQLREKIGIGQSRGGDALSEIGNRFGNNPDALFIFKRQEKWTEKGTVDAVAKG
jgi:hypothetical protein